jgi:uncharacterized membrane protein YkoI
MNRAAFLLACAMLAAAPAWADVSRDEAATRAVQSAAGRVLSIEKGESGGRAVWRVKIVTPQGEVKVVLVDAASGRVI